MAEVPQHRPDAPISFIWSGESSWKDDLFQSETTAMPKEDRGGHIVTQYIAGLTRGDLSAPDKGGRIVTSYVGDDAARIEVKRLGLVDVARCRDAGGRVGQLHSARLAYDGDLDHLFAERGALYVFELGEFALRCSEAPRPGESKRSDS